MNFKTVLTLTVIWLMFAVVASAQVTPIKVNEFLNSVGVCTHIIQGIDNPRKVAIALTYAGFRHVREDGTHSRSLLATLVDIHNLTGVTFDQLPVVNTTADGGIADSVAEYEQLAADGALLSAEGPNEPNNFPVFYQRMRSGVNTTFLPVARYQHDLYTAVKADPKLAGHPVFASSEAGGAEPDNQGLQFLTIPAGAGALMPDGTTYADYANVHSYLRGNGMTAPINNTAWGAAANGASEGTWDGLFGEYGITWHKGFKGYTIPQLMSLPKVITETGWETAGTNSITEDQQGKLLTNLYLSATARHWTYTFVYMLVDEPQANNGHYGFFRQDYSSKLSATYLRNMTTILADTTSSFEVVPLSYFIPNKPATVHDLLMQKSNGLYELAVWGDQVNGSNNITINLPSRPLSVKVYDVTSGASPIHTLGNVGSIHLTLGDHAMILEFVVARFRSHKEH